METNLTIVYWCTFNHQHFKEKILYVAATEQGLCRITWPSESFETLSTWVEKHIPNADLIENEELLNPYTKQIQEYLDHNRQEFTIDLDLRGTQFQVAVWRALAQIPYGETRSYSDIAEAVNRHSAVRAVGTANGANPVPIIIPCHRVIGKNSTLTGFRGGLKVKEDLLKLEGFHEYRSEGHARFMF